MFPKLTPGGYHVHYTDSRGYNVTYRSSGGYSVPCINYDGYNVPNNEKGGYNVLIQFLKMSWPERIDGKERKILLGFAQMVKGMGKLVSHNK